MSDYESKPPSVGLWANTGDRGPVASGNCGNIRFVLWKNTKGGPNAPDYRLVMEQSQKRDKGDTNAPRQHDSAPGGTREQPEDEIPF